MTDVTWIKDFTVGMSKREIIEWIRDNLHELVSRFSVESLLDTLDDETRSLVMMDVQRYIVNKICGES